MIENADLTELEDIVLGPPKLTFNSTSRNQNRSNDNPDSKNADTFGADVVSPGPGRPSFRDKSLKGLEDEPRERDLNDGFGLRRRDEDGWTSVRSGRNRGQDSERWPRGDRDRDRDRMNKDGEISEAPLRRNGIGRGRIDKPWREESGTTTADSSRPTGSWRERERDRERNRDSAPRARYDQKVEEEPEWMLDEASEEPSKPARTQEDFQRWMESQKINKASSTSVEEKVQSSTTPDAGKQPKESVPKPPAPTPSSTANAFGGLFGGWDEKKLDGLKSDGQPISKASVSNPKTSRFFPKEATAPAPVPAPEPERPATASPAVADKPPSTDEDKAGFQRILSMLNSKSPTDAPTILTPSTAVQEPQSARERGFPPPLLPNGPQIDNADFLAEVLARQGLGRDVKSVPPSRAGLPVTREQEHVSKFFPPDYIQYPNGRGENITPHIASIGHPPEVGGLPHNAGMPHLDQEREFLLSLMNSRPHSQQPRVAEAELEEIFQRQQMQARAQQPPPMQGPTPGYWGPPRRGPQPPPGFSEMEESQMMGLQRRKTTDVPPRGQMTNMGIPSQHAMPPEWMKNPPPGMPMPNHPERPNIAPPPGFAGPPHVGRGGPPPGYMNGPPIPANMNNGALTHPGSRGGPPGMFPGFFGPNGPGPQQLGMNPPPPGFMMGPGGGRGGFSDFPPLPNEMGRGRGNPPPGFPTL